MDVELPYEPLVDLGEGEPIILLHGLCGGLSNWQGVIAEFCSTHRVLVPRLPLYSDPISNERLQNLVDYLDGFIDAHGFNKVVLMGNSLGGHIALLYTLKKLALVEKMVLTGSYGMFENSFGSTFPNVKDDDYINGKVPSTLLLREVASKDLADGVFDNLQSRLQTLSKIGMAKESQFNNIANILSQITLPTLLVWGLQDTITPPHIALEFHDLLPGSTVAFIDSCGHIPMMEQPESFNEHVRSFLQ